MIRKSFVLLVFSTLIFLSGCRSKQTGEIVSTDKKPKDDKYAPYVEGNKKILRWETEEMGMFIKRYHWNMQRTGTGLYVEVLQPGDGECYKENDMVTMEYQTFLLNGQMIYNSKEDGLKQFKVDRSEEIDALHEVVKTLRPGAKARLLIPSYLAYGVPGDGDKIQGRKSIAMIIEIIP